MKYVVLMLLMFVGFAASAQQILLTKKDGEKIETAIVGRSNDILFITNNQIHFSDIAEVAFAGYDSDANELHRYLKSRNIIVTYSYKVGALSSDSTITVKPVSSVMVNTPEEMSKNAVIGIEQLRNSLESYRSQRSTGKFMQVAGILITSGAAALQAKYNNDNLANLAKPKYEPKYVAPGVYMVGGLVGAIGFVVDWNAGSHLRKQK